MKKQLLATMLILGLLAPNLTYSASAADTSRESFLELFFGDAPEAEVIRTTASVEEEPEDSNIIHLPQQYPALIEGEAEVMLTAAATYVVGSTATFKVMQTKDSSALTTATGTIMYQSDHANVWLIGQTNAAQGALTAAQYEAIGTKTDAIYNLMTSQLATHSGVTVNPGYANLSAVGDIDLDGRINVLLYDIYSDGNSSGGYVAGYFYSGDYYTNIASTVVDAIHMDIGESQGYVNLTDGDGADFYSTIAHEFQHMLFYMYCGCKMSDSGASLTWFNESLSALTEQYYSTGVSDQSQNASQSKMILANQNSYADGDYFADYYDYGDFFNFNNSFKTYGMVNLLSSMLYKQTSGTYGADIYSYLKTIANNQYSASTATTLVGNALKTALGSDFADYTADQVLTYVYDALMVNYIADGGTVYNGDTSYNTYSLWDGYHLWSKKDLSYKVYDYFSTAYDTVANGDTFSLVGYPSDEGSVEASHEITLNLTTATNSADTYLNISVAQTDGLQAYIALYDTATQTADVYPLTLGADNGIDTKGKKAYLFATTINEDVENVAVSYQWSQDGFVPQGTIATNTLTDTGSALALTVSFDMVTVGDQSSSMLVAFYNGGQLVDVQITQVGLTVENQIPLTKPTAYDSYQLFLADAQWDYVPLLTAV